MPPVVDSRLHPPFLEGEALTYYRSLATGRPATTIAWSEFDQGLRQTFEKINQSASARAQLHCNSWGVWKLTTSILCGCVQRSLSEITDMPLSEGDKVFPFRHGLRSDVRKFVAMDPRTSKAYASFTKITNAALAFGTCRKLIAMELQLLHMVQVL